MRVKLMTTNTRDVPLLLDKTWCKASSSHDHNTARARIWPFCPTPSIHSFSFLLSSCDPAVDGGGGNVIDTTAMKCHN